MCLPRHAALAPSPLSVSEEEGLPVGSVRLQDRQARGSRHHHLAPGHRLGGGRWDHREAWLGGRLSLLLLLLDINALVGELSSFVQKEEIETRESLDKIETKFTTMMKTSVKACMVFELHLAVLTTT